jgi:protein TonB
MRTSVDRGAAMFQESLVESTPLLRGRNRWPALISFATQATLVSVLIAIPILHPEVLPTGPIKLSRLDPPPLPHPVPPLRYSRFE